MSTTVLHQGAADRDAARRQELGAFLRARREQLRPEDVGLQRYGRRRVNGLRREEVAQLASVSLSWYTWLEQARNIRMSPDALDAVAKALCLNRDEYEHFRRLAGAPIGEADNAEDELPPELLGLLDDLLPNAAHLVNGAHDILAWNRASALLFGDLERLEAEYRNSVWMFFMTELRDLIGDWDGAARGLVARLRHEAGKYPEDSRFASLIEALSDASDEFREFWHCQEVRSVVDPVRTVHHPVVGTIRQQIIQLRPAQNPALILFIHRPADEESRSRMEQLLKA